MTERSENQYAASEKSAQKIDMYQGRQNPSNKWARKRSAWNCSRHHLCGSTTAPLTTTLIDSVPFYPQDKKSQV